MLSIGVVAFTGHRPQKFAFGFDESHPDCLELKDVLREAIYKAIGRGARYFITGMALGVDMWAAEEIIDCRKVDAKIQLEAAIPCRNQERVWPKALQDRYHQILAQCNKVTLVTDAPFDPKVMQIRNRYMVDKCDLLIAVYDGSRGGTKQTVDYALETGKRVLRIDPRDLSLSEIGEGRKEKTA